LFERALELDPHERREFVEREASDTPLVALEVRRLLVQWSADSNFLEAPVNARPVAPFAAQVAELALGSRIGGYRIECVLGSGGMGTVYLAHQERPARKVALKLMRAGLGSPAEMRRFEAEAEILGRLRHPSIAIVHEFGVHAADTGAVPYFAMEYVEGSADLVSYAHAKSISIRGRVELAIALSDAVQYAHGKGVIHRDIKPGNVLVDERGVVKVIDFGVARIVEAEFARSVGATGGEVLGTLAYASPEQLTGDWRDVDVRADVYSIGATLFELFAGRPPFLSRERALVPVLRELCETPAPSLASVAPLVPRELGWIVAKCLEKDRERRYGTSAELARDLRRWLASEPVLAAPPSVLYRARKLVARHRVPFAAAAVVFTSLVIALAVSVSKTREVEAQRQIAVNAGQVSEREAQSARDALAEAERQRQIAAQASEQSQRDADAARLEARRRQSVIDSLRSMLGAVSPDQDGRHVTLFELLERRRSSLESEFADDPRLRVQLQSLLIEAYGNLGLAEHGLELAESALRTMEATDGYSVSEISAMQFFLARRYYERGRMQDGAALVERARALLDIGQPLPEDGVAALQMQAMALEKAGRVEESIAAFDSALEAARASLGDDHLMTLMLMTDAALGHALQRRLDVAERLTREAHERARRVLPEGHSMLPLFLMRLGSVLNAAGKTDESIELQRAVVAQTESLFGERHRNVAQAHRELAAVLLGARRYPESAAAAQRALELVHAHHRGDAELESTVRGVLGGALDGLWRFEDSLDNWRACVELFEELGRRTDPYALQSRIGVGSALLYLKRFEESEVSLREALDVAAGALAPDDAMVGYTRLLVGQAIGQQPGRLREGYDEVAAAYEILARHSGTGPRKRAREALEMLAGAAEGAGRAADLERWRALLAQQ
jgi:serine/threonine protein kinase